MFLTSRPRFFSTCQLFSKMALNPRYLPTCHFLGGERDARLGEKSDAACAEVAGGGFLWLTESARGSHFCKFSIACGVALLARPAVDAGYQRRTAEQVSSGIGRVDACSYGAGFDACYGWPQVGWDAPFFPVVGQVCHFFESGQRLKIAWKECRSCAKLWAAGFCG
jgi:hypothetical protein